jgi:radical SAM superfamily enzyme YgiQ (UPF0313 family)
VRLLLINPKYPESFWSFKWALDRILPDKRAVNPPLGLATLAALCPLHWQVEIVDENIEPVPTLPAADLIGVCGMGVQFARQRELLEYYRARGYFVVAGGSYTSLCPEHYATIADAVVAGEAEYVWPRFCRDFEAGQTQRLYRETGSVDLADSPTPRFELLKLDRYSTATLQFSRGCPYRCDFCDIIVMFGRKPRCKTPAQVAAELDALRAAGCKNVFFVDDNLIGNRPKAKALLRKLIDYQTWHGYAFRFGTEVSINLAQDHELLQLMREAHFEWVFVGIESPDSATLRDARKTQNTHEDVLTSVRRIYSYGIDVLAGFIVGFDNDTLETFDLQYRFIVGSGIQAAMVGLLTALPKTPLYLRLEEEGRLRQAEQSSDNTKLATNITPKRMSYDAMIEAYRQLYQRLTSDHAIAQRVRNKIRYMGDPVYVGEYARSQQLGIVTRLIVRGVLRGGPRRIYQFLRTLPLRAPRKLPLVIVDWIGGLAMHDYVRRHFSPAVDPNAASIARRLAALRKAIGAYLGEGRVALSLDQATRSRIVLSVSAAVDQAFFVRARRHLSALLEHTPSTLTLNIGHLLGWESKHARRLLTRLARYGDRVFIVADERVRQLVPIDWSRFNLVLQSDTK